METRTLRTEEIAGLGAAVLLHGLLLVVLLAKPDPVVVEPVRSVTVSLADDVGLEETSPTPVPESRAAIAPTLSDAPAPPIPLGSADTVPEPAPQPFATRAPPVRPATRASA
ncbi:MAG: energy transducer TonB, partial [Pontixanthobacter sp.]